MKKITRTAVGDALQAAKHLGVAHVIVPKTTLNEKFDIQSGILPAAGEIPATRYYAIGNGGHRITLSANNKPITDPIDHSAADGALYAHLPFVLRPVANDLTSEQRKNYHLRKPVTVGGANYYGYWLKPLPVADVEITMEVTAGGITKPFVPDSSNLNPTPPTIASTGTTPTSDAYLSVAAPVVLDFNEFDTTELINACKILFNDEREAIVSEIAICSGVEKLITITTTGGLPAQFKEVIACQVTTFISADHNLAQNNQGFIKDLELGCAEALPAGSTTNVVSVNV